MRRQLRGAFSLGMAAVMLAGVWGIVPSIKTEAVSKVESNASLLPAYEKETAAADANTGDAVVTPNWVKSAIIAEINPYNIKATNGAFSFGNVESYEELLDYYADLGVNCLWIDPVNEAGENTSATDGSQFPNGYTNIGLDTIEPDLTGTRDYTQGWQRFAEFVEAAHQRNIRIILDVVIWGVSDQADKTRTITVGGETKTLKDVLQNSWFGWNDSQWGGPKYNYSDTVFQNWYAETMTRIVNDCNLDGIRVDLASASNSYKEKEIFTSVRNQADHNIVIIAEHAVDHTYPFDLEQMGLMPYKEQSGASFNSRRDAAWSEVLTNHSNAYYFTTGGRNVVEVVKNGVLAGDSNESGEKQYYTNTYTTHDNNSSGNMPTSAMAFGYSTIFTPYIPVCYMGEASNDRSKVLTNGNADPALYFTGFLDYSALKDPVNQAYYDTVKRYIKIRRTYSGIFESFAANTKNNNITAVTTTMNAASGYQAYARYGDGKAILVIPNGTGERQSVGVTVPGDMGISGTVNVVDLLTGRKLSQGAEGSFETVLEEDVLGLYLVTTENYEEAEDCDENHYTVTAEDVRVSSKNADVYQWPITFTEYEEGARMKYDDTAVINTSGAPYMQNLRGVNRLDGMHLKLTLHNDAAADYGDANFMARKFVIKLSNSEGRNGTTNDLRFTFCANNRDPYIDVMNVTAENVGTQRFYFWDYLNKFGDAVDEYDIYFVVNEDNSVTMKVNEIAVDIAAAAIVEASDTDVRGRIYTYVAADTNGTDLTLNMFHGGEETCYNCDRDENHYTVTAEDVRVSSQNNASEYVWPIDFKEDADGARMGYHLYTAGTTNTAGSPYMQNLRPVTKLDGMHLKLTLHNDVAAAYADANFMARKFVLKLANSANRNVGTNDLRFTFCVNDRDPYIDVMNVTAENVSTQRFSFTNYLDKFGDKVNNYDISFRVNSDDSLTMTVNGIDISLATAALVDTTDTDLNGVIYTYIAADTDGTDLTLNTFHGGEETCYDGAEGTEGEKPCEYVFGANGEGGYEYTCGMHGEHIAYGDINHDGAVDVRDLMRGLRYFAGTAELPNEVTGDLDLDGRLSDKDLVFMRKQLLGIALTDEARYTVTAEDVRVSSENNESEYKWPIDFSEDADGVRMVYHLQRSGAPANSAGAPYMQNLRPVAQLDGMHLKLTLHNNASAIYGDTDFMARKFVLKLANSANQNGATNDLRFTFCVNDADPYIDVMSVTADNVSTQRFYFSGQLDRFGNSVDKYDILFKVNSDGGLTMYVNGIAVDIATAAIVGSTSTNLNGTIYTYVAADTDGTDITLNMFHGGEEMCFR